MPTARICNFPPRRTIVDLCAPSREDDEAVLAVMRGLEDRGVFIVTEDDPIPTGAKLIVQPCELVAVAAQAAGPMSLGDLIARDSNVSPTFANLFKSWAV